MGPVAAILPGNRLHLQHGPIDLVIGAEGAADDVRRALRAARDRFQTVLPELVEELPALRRPVDPAVPLNGPVARRMSDAVAAQGSVFVTPMAAVAGSVADEILCTMRLAAPGLPKIWVNNGGDIALHLSGEASFSAAIVADSVSGREAGRMKLTASDRVSGIATSGRHGRSLSLGVADAVTVLAGSAAQADVAATLIANAVDLPEHPSIRREPANQIDPDSDLGERPVTVEVGSLSVAEVEAALVAGRNVADRMVQSGRILSAILCLNDQVLLSSGADTRSPAPGLDPPAQPEAVRYGSVTPSRLRTGSPDQVSKQASVFHSLKREPFHSQGRIT